MLKAAEARTGTEEPTTPGRSCTPSSAGCPSGSAGRSCSATWRAGTYEEAARSSDVRSGTIKSRLATARERLRGRLEQA